MPLPHITQNFLWTQLINPSSVGLKTWLDHKADSSITKTNDKDDNRSEDEARAAHHSSRIKPPTNI
jgi:hypothetical protein